MVFPPVTLPNIPGLGSEVPEKAAEKQTNKKVKLSVLVKEAGFPDGENELTRAVIGGESGFNPRAKNFCCHGLMQINWNAHKNGVLKQLGITKLEELYEPRKNLKAGYLIWKGAGGSFAPDWEAYTNGSYKRYLGKDPLINVDGSGGIPNPLDLLPDVPNPLDGLQTLSQFFGLLMDRNTWFRAGKVIVGGFLVGTGTTFLLFMIFKVFSKQAKTVKKTGSDVAGAAASAATVARKAIVKV